jgi:hypothetical protein
LSRIEVRAFSQAGLVEIILSASIEVLGEGCFSKCKSCSSVTFEQKSRLRRVGPNVFMRVPVHPTLPTKTSSGVRSKAVMGVVENLAFVLIRRTLF